MDGFKYATGVVFFDPVDIREMYKAFAVRVTDTGDIEVLVFVDDTISWTNISDAEQIDGPSH